MARLFLRVAFAFAALCASVSHAEGLASAPEQALTADAAVAAVDRRLEEAYREMRTRYDTVAEAEPGDIQAMVSQCQFIESFVDYDGGRYIETAEADLEACQQQLARVAPKDPRVRVYLFENEWGPQSVATGNTLFKQGTAWPADLRRRVAAKLSQSVAETDPERAGELAVVAAGLGDASMLPEAVAHLARRGDTRRAVALLESLPPSEGGWMATQRIEAALKLDDGRAALDDVRRHQSRKLEVVPALVVQAHLHAGDVSAAQSALQAAGDDIDDVQDARFRIAFANKDWPAAAATIDLTDMEAFTDNLARFAKLLVAAPWSLAMPSLWLSVLVLVGLALAFALVPGVVLLPVHYRGALRRLKGRAPKPLFATVGLRQAWLASAALILLPMVVLGIIDGDALARMLADNVNPDGRTLLLLSLWASALGLLVFAQPLRRLWLTDGFGWARAWRAWWRIGIAWLGTLAVGFALAAWHHSSGTDTNTAQVRMVADLVNSGQGAWQMALAFFAVAVLVPVWEECVFRGLFLGGVARHISFGWANLLQATLFALVHDDAPRFVYYLVLGLFAGWLVRSTRSLAPAIVLHMLINGIAFAMLQR
jgi:membrane protease YdiL (CAAX protease family)